MSDNLSVKLPRTVILPWRELLKSALKLAEIPEELADASRYKVKLHGDVQPGRETFTVTILEVQEVQSE